MDNQKFQQTSFRIRNDELSRFFRMYLLQKGLTTQEWAMQHLKDDLRAANGKIFGEKIPVDLLK